MIDVSWLLFVVASLALIAVPGQDMILVMSRSIAQGSASGIVTAAGVSVGLLGHTVLATLGLLDGLECTTHYGSYDRLQEAAPKAVVRRDVRVADNGHIVTGAGVSAGIDLALHMIARLYGMQEASDVAQYMMYRWADEDRARAEDLAAAPA